MKTLLAIVTVSLFGKESLDKNGKQAMYLSPVAGKIPNRNILAGTVAEKAGFEHGKSYLVNVRETEPSKEFGRQFQFTKVTEVGAMDIIMGCDKLGEASIFDVAQVEEKETV